MWFSMLFKQRFLPLVLVVPNLVSVWTWLDTVSNVQCVKCCLPQSRVKNTEPVFIFKVHWSFRRTRSSLRYLFSTCTQPHPVNRSGRNPIWTWFVLFNLGTIGSNRKSSTEDLLLLVWIHTGGFSTDQNSVNVWSGSNRRFGSEMRKDDVNPFKHELWPPPTHTHLRRQKAKCCFCPNKLISHSAMKTPWCSLTLLHISFAPPVCFSPPPAVWCHQTQRCIIWCRAWLAHLQLTGMLHWRSVAGKLLLHLYRRHMADVLSLEMNYTCEPIKSLKWTTRSAFSDRHRQAAGYGLLKSVCWDFYLA